MVYGLGFRVWKLPTNITIRQTACTQGKPLVANAIYSNQTVKMPFQIAQISKQLGAIRVKLFMVQGWIRYTSGIQGLWSSYLLI